MKVLFLFCSFNMGKTAAERQRERRQRLRENPAEWNEYLERDRKRKNTARKNLSPGELKTLRARTLAAVKKHRGQIYGDGTEALEQTYKYGSTAALGKAKSRVMKSLPKSPRKRKTVLRALACDVLDAHVVFTQPNRRLSQETVDAVLAFYQDESVSRMMPGKADCITVRSSGKKVKKQKRHLTMTLSEAYSCFKADHPQIDIGKSKFAELRPK